MIARVFLIFSLSVLSLSAAKIHWSHDFEEAKAKAHKEHKILYVLITSETCKWCRKIESTTLKRPAVIRAIKKRYVAVALTRDKDSYPKCLKAKMVPMSYFINPEDQRVIYSVPGFWVEEDYLSILSDVERKYKKQQRKNYSK